MKTSTIFALLIGVGSALPAGAELYRWVDENGKVHYGDRIPPEYAKSERQVLDKSGARVKEVLDRELTDEELAEKRRQQEAAAAAAAAAAEQARYDKYLLATYPSVGDLISARNDRLETIDGQILANEKGITDTNRVISDLNGRVAKLKAEGKRVPPNLEKQIKLWEKQLVKNKEAGEILRADRESTASTFERDILRYRQLRGLQQPQAAADG